jgi:hypothetical protein
MEDLGRFLNMGLHRKQWGIVIYILFGISKN